MAESARYLYVVSRNLDADALEAVTGLRGEPLAVVSQGGLDAVVSDVPLSEFGETGLKRNLEDLEWLEQVARGHDDVVQAAGAIAPVAPLRLATICLDDGAVRARLEEWRDDLHRVLDRVEGCVEWSVKVILPPTDRAPSGSSAATPGSGAAYLKQKKSQQEERDRRLARSSNLGGEIHRDLARFTVATRLLAPQDPQLAGYAGTMLLNGAYLVDATASARFQARVDDLAHDNPDLRLEAAGPWPPYSFAVLDST